MKRFFLTIAILAVAASAYALTSEFVLNSIVAYPCTKTATVPVTYTEPLTYQTAASGCVVYKDTVATNTGFPVVANIAYKVQPAFNGNLVFTCSSSATGTIYIMK